MELWKAITGYEGYYEVSNLGRVRSIDHTVNSGNGNTYIWKGRSLKPRKNSAGYLRVQLSKNGKVKWAFIHRLVAEAFLEKSGSIINHKNEIKIDNRADNLEWCTASYNCSYGNKNAKAIEVSSKEVLQFTSGGTCIAAYKSTREAERETGVFQSHISAVCRGRRKTAGGFIWKYAQEAEQ